MKIKNLLFALSLVLVFTHFVYGQTPYQWGTVLTDKGYRSEARGIAIDQKKNSYVTGAFTGPINFGAADLTSRTDSSDIFVAKYDPSGKCVWAFSLGGDNGDAGTAIYSDASGYIYVTGYFTGTVSFDPQSTKITLTSDKFPDVFLAKYDSQGKFLWARSMGGDGRDMASSISVDNNSGVYVCGSFDGSVIDLDMPNRKIFSNSKAGTKDIFIAKYTTDGKYQWGGSIGNANHDEAKSIYADPNSSSVYLGGYYNGSANFDFLNRKNLISSMAVDGFIARYEAFDGTCGWAISIGGKTNDEVSDLATDPKGNVCATGNYTGGVSFDGKTSHTSNGAKDVFLALYDPSGINIWGNSFGGVLDDAGNGIDISSNGSIYLTGYFAGDNVCFDPNLKSGFLTSYKSLPNVFMARYTNGGAYFWAQEIVSNVLGVGSAIISDGNGKLNLAGYVGGDGNLDPIKGNGPFNSDANGDILIVQYDTRMKQSLIQNPNPIPVKMFGDPAFPLSVTSSSGLPVTLANLSSSVIGISGNMVTMNTGGNASIFASQGGDEDYLPVSNTISFIIKRAPQVITFAAIPNKTFGNAAFTVLATSDKGLPVTLSSNNNGVATVSGSIITINGAGIVSISAFQPGNLNYDSARVIQTFTVNKANQVITFPSLTDKMYGDIPFTITASVSSNLPLNFISSDASLVTVTGNTLTIKGIGTVTITASQPGNGNYNAAAQVSQGLLIIAPEAKISGREIVGDNSIQKYSIVPALAGYDYVWSSTDKNVIFSDTIGPNVTIAFSALAFPSSSLICKLYDPAGIPKDTIEFPLRINQNANIYLPPACTQIDSFHACSGSYLDYVELESLVNSGSGCSATGYSDYSQSELTTKLYMGDVYSAKVKVGYNGVDKPSYYVGCWIDYNNNGNFEDVGEFLSSFFGSDSIIDINNLAISNNENYEGGRRIRIRVRTSGSFTSSEGCTQQAETGESEDYMVILSRHDRLEAPQIITPNEDGKNDFFVIHGIDVALSSKLTIFDRMGRIFFKEENYVNTWGGKDSGGNMLPQGTYFYTFNNGDKSLKGFFQLVY